MKLVPIIATILIAMITAGCLGGNPIIPPDDDEERQLSPTPFLQDWTTENLEWTNSTSGYFCNVTYTGEYKTCWGLNRKDDGISTVQMEIYRPTLKFNLWIHYGTIDESAYENVDRPINRGFDHTIRIHGDTDNSSLMCVVFGDPEEQHEFTTQNIEIPDPNNIVISILGNTIFINGVSISLDTTYTGTNFMFEMVDPANTHYNEGEEPFIEWVKVT